MVYRGGRKTDNLMPMRKHFIEGMTLYKYCKVHGINYNRTTAIMSLYQLTPEDAVKFTKQKGYSKLLKEHGITHSDPKYQLCYQRLRQGWDIEDVVNVPKLPKGGRWKNKRLAAKLLEKYNIKSDDPKYSFYVRRIQAGWSVEDAINIPKLPKGGNWRNKRNEYRKND